MNQSFNNGSPHFGRVQFSGIGCLLVVAFLGLAVYLFFKNLYPWLYKFSPVLLGIALILNWKLVFNFAMGLWRLLARSPITGLLVLGLVVLALPFVCAFLIFGAFGIRSLEKFQQQMSDSIENRMKNFDPGDEEYVDYEEVKDTPPASKKQLEE